MAASAEQARFVMSVSTGSLLLAAAGLLADRDASGHWLATGVLEAAGAHPSEEAGDLDRGTSSPPRARWRRQRWRPPSPSGILYGAPD